MNTQNNSNNLWKLIKKRLETERILENTFNIHYTTNYDFRDINGFSLLHYAAIEGNDDTIAELVTLGVNLDLLTYYCKRSALQLALESNHLNIAKNLHAAGVSSANLTLRNIKNQQCRQWAYHIIEHKLNQSKYDIERKIQLAAMVGEVKLLKQFYREHSRSFLQSISGQSTALQATPLVTLAIEHGQFEVAKLLLNDLGTHSIRACQNDMLNKALENEQNSIAAYLLQHRRRYRVSIEHTNKQSQSAILICAVTRNVTMFELLLNAGANTRVTDRLANNILHYIATNNDQSLLDILILNLPHELNALCRQHNAYGETPFNIAVRMTHKPLAALLAKHSPTPFVEEPYSGIGFTISFNHTIIQRKLTFFLKMNYQASTLLEQNCPSVALNFFFLYYAHQSRLPYFYSCLKLISSWDGNDESLESPFSKTISSPGANSTDEPLARAWSVVAKHHSNLQSLFDKWSQDIAWFHKTRASQQRLELKQSTRNKHTEATPSVAIFPGTTPLYAILSQQSLPRSQIKGAIDDFMHKCAGSCMELRNRYSACTLYRLPNDKIAYYNSSTHFAMKPFDNSAQLADLIYKQLVSKHHQTPSMQNFFITMNEYRFEQQTNLDALAVRP